MKVYVSFPVDYQFSDDGLRYESVRNVVLKKGDDHITHISATGMPMWFNVEYVESTGPMRSGGGIYIVLQV